MAQSSGSESGDGGALVTSVSTVTGLRPYSPDFEAKMAAIGRPVVAAGMSSVVTVTEEWHKFVTRFMELRI